MTVSVVIPCFNQGRFLSQAIESVLGQTHPQVEVIVVDDGSADHTGQVAASHGPRVRLVRQENAGVSAARNTGLAGSKGELVLFLDADDWLLPDALEKLVAAARAHPEIAVFHGSSRWMDSNGRITDQRRAADLGDDPFHRLLRGNTIPIHSILIRRKALEAIPFDVTLRGGEDWELLLRLALEGCRFQPVPDAWAIYRRHGASASSSYELMRRDLGRTIERYGRVHRRCWRCRLALLLARRNLSFNAFEELLLPRLLQKLRSGEPAQAVAELAKAIAGDPRVLRVLLVEHWLVWAARRIASATSRLRNAGRGSGE